MASHSSDSGKSGKRPDSFAEALRRLDEALLVPAPTFSEALSEDVTTARERVNESVAASKQKLRESFVNGRDAVTTKTSQAVAVVNEKVRQNIWPVLGGVAVGTFALGFLIANRRRGEVSEEVEIEFEPEIPDISVRQHGDSDFETDLESDLVTGLVTGLV